MKTINLLLTALLFSVPQHLDAQSCTDHNGGLQSIINHSSIVRQDPASPDKHSRKTATISRIIAQTDLNFDGAVFVPYDSIMLTYSGSRGGDLNHLGTELKFDNAYIYYYNSTTSTWSNSAKQTQTFDASDNVLTTVAQNWHASTSTWVNAAENVYTWSGGNLQNYINQSWDTVGSAWLNVSKYLYTYDAAHNMLTSIRQNWNSSTSLWVNNLQTTYTYNINNKVTSEIGQTWDTATHAWLNDYKYTYTYDATNTYVLTKVNQSWNSGSSTWDNVNQHIYTYDGMNNRLTDLAQSWIGAIWENGSLATFSSFIAQLPQVEVYQIWNSGTLAFENNNKHTYTYNGENLLTSETSQSWNIGGFWQSTTSDNQSRYYYQTYTTGLSTVAANGGSAIIYPVPAREVLHTDITWSEPQSFSARIYNLQGAIIRQWDVPACSSYSADLPLDLPSGNYFIKFNGTNGNIVRQFAVMR